MLKFLLSGCILSFIIAIYEEYIEQSKYKSLQNWKESAVFILLKTASSWSYVMLMLIEKIDRFISK